ncbi:hypothetical protein ABXN37_28295 [Piscinibacter sakaiensis]|uniref:hypothetical protein n=1 Tax=Piscinibacter sakaiensis TaxID=1547922 RepID=UPI00372A9426
MRPDHPARFRRPALLVVGCGDVGLRVLRQLGGRLRVLALSSQRRASPLVGNLDRPSSLRAGRGLRPRLAAHDGPSGGHPRERVARGTPVLRPQDDVYTNHIQADDLARACIAALWRGKPQRVVHASDDSTLAMGDYMDLAADLAGLPRPPRVSREEARRLLTPMAYSFLAESRRLDNARLKNELRLRLRYPTVREGL